MDEILRIKEKYTDHFLKIKNVVAVGVGYKKIRGQRKDEPCIVVSVTEKVDCASLPASQQLPRHREGVRVDVQETGEFYALQDRTDKWHPAPGGVSIGHVNVTAGTLGCLVFKNGEPFILSNNHVLADSNHGQPGDAVVQPGSHDGGTLDDQIATLEYFVPVEFDLPDCPVAEGAASVLNRLARLARSPHRFRVAKQGGPNLVDAAIARPLSLDYVKYEILEIGGPAGTAEAELGLPVQKSGRTTGLTQGKVTQVAVTVRVLYDNNIATFEDQVMAALACGGGDSGSVGLDLDNRVVGLLFAGTQDGKTTVFSRARNVEAALGVTFQ